MGRVLLVPQLTGNATNGYKSMTVNGIRRCRSCGQDKRIEQFVHRKYPNGKFYPRYCRPCHVKKASEYRASHPDQRKMWSKSPRGNSRKRAAERAWRLANPDAHKEIHRKAWLKRKYGISEQDYWLMAARQSGRCAICEKECAKMDVDHDHATGAIRQLLCGPCNRGLGCFADNTLSLASAIGYLHRHSGQVFSEVSE